jgi:lysine-ketoglutarate reductase/saccharopine dehydrogenase-like protein (TIGR00300 family)
MALTWKDVQQDGVAPEGFLVTSNRKTELLLNGKWAEVKKIRMDGLVVLANGAPECKILRDIRKGDKVLLKEGSEKEIQEHTHKAEAKSGEFEFFSSPLSGERNVKAEARGLAEEMKRVRKSGKKILFVCGPAVVHCGAREHFIKLIKKGWVDIIFTGNAFAVHDMEAALYGTSLGVSVETGENVPDGHSNHIRAINRITGAGGVYKAVESKLVKGGVVYEAIQKKIPLVMAGSIRDDGPLPETICDSCKAQEIMGKHLEEAGLIIVVATMLHGIATGNMASAEPKFVCVDTNMAVVSKLIDRGSDQTKGVIASASEFLRELADAL